MYIFSDVNADIFVTRKNESTKAVTKEKIAFIWKISALKDSSRKGVSFSFNDSIGIDIHLTIISSTPFSVFIALPTNDSCSNYEAMARLGCDVDCTYQECVFEYAEPDGHHGHIMYCRYKCPQTSLVLIRRAVQPGMRYLPSDINILKLAALAI